jgi:hypothetical protein
MKNTDAVMLTKLIFLVVRGEKICKREEVNALVMNERDRDIMISGYRDRLERAYGPDVEIFETHKWLPMSCSRSVAAGLFHATFNQNFEGDDENANSESSGKFNGDFSNIPVREHGLC